MQSIFAKIYLHLVEKIQKEIPQIKWIDQDLGQLESYGDRPPVKFPCLLLDLEDIIFSDMGMGAQIGEGHILFRLAFQPWSNSNAVTPLEYRKKAIEYYEIEHQLHQILHQYSCDHFGPMSRVNTMTEERNDPLRVRQIRYSITFEELRDSEFNQAIPDDKELDIIINE